MDPLYWDKFVQQHCLSMVTQRQIEHAKTLQGFHGWRITAVQQWLRDRNEEEKARLRKNFEKMCLDLSLSFSPRMPSQLERV